MVSETSLELMGESQGGNTITLALTTSGCLQPGPDLTPRASLIGIFSPEADLTWQLLASTAPLRLEQAEGYGNRKLESTIKYKKGKEDGYTGSIGVSPPQGIAMLISQNAIMRSFGHVAHNVAYIIPPLNSRKLPVSANLPVEVTCPKSSP